MFGDPGMIGRALEGDVQGELHAVFARGGGEVLEIGEGAELRMDGLVAAFGGADGPGAAVIAFGGDDVVVGAFAEGVADGVDGRQVEDVEAHGGDLGQQGFDIAQGAVAAGVGRGGARKELVPGGEAGAFAVDPDAEVFVVAGGELQVRVARRDLADLVGDGELVDLGVLVCEPAQGDRDLFELLRVFALGSGLAVVEQERSGPEGEGDVLR